MLRTCLAIFLLIFPALCSAAERLMVCGGATVYQIDPAASAEKPVKSWAWQAKDCKELPEALRGVDG